MFSDADGQSQERRWRERWLAELVKRAEPAQVTGKVGRCHAVEAAQPVLQAAVIAIDVVDMPGADSMGACAGVDGVRVLFL